MHFFKVHHLSWLLTLLLHFCHFLNFNDAFICGNHHWRLLNACVEGCLVKTERAEVALETRKNTVVISVVVIVLLRYLYCLWVVVIGIDLPCHHEISGIQLGVLLPLVNRLQVLLGRLLTVMKILDVQRVLPDVGIQTFIFLRWLASVFTWCLWNHQVGDCFLLVVLEPRILGVLVVALNRFLIHVCHGRQQRLLELPLLNRAGTDELATRCDTHLLVGALHGHSVDWWLLVLVLRVYWLDRLLLASNLALLLNGWFGHALDVNCDCVALKALLEEILVGFGVGWRFNYLSWWLRCRLISVLLHSSWPWDNLHSWFVLQLLSNRSCLHIHLGHSWRPWHACTVLPADGRWLLGLLLLLESVLRNSWVGWAVPLTECPFELLLHLDLFPLEILDAWDLLFPWVNVGSDGGVVVLNHWFLHSVFVLLTDICLVWLLLWNWLCSEAHWLGLLLSNQVLLPQFLSEKLLRLLWTQIPFHLILDLRIV